MRLFYRPPEGYDPSDATELPDGRIVVLNRRFALPFCWSAVLTVIDLRGVKAGQVVAGREIAQFAAPLTVDNFEGMAVTMKAARRSCGWSATTTSCSCSARC